MNSIEVLSAGLYSSIQDRGRKGFRSFGVPLSGAMDQLSADLGNAILGNNFDTPVLETTMIGPKLLFNQETTICITGADMSPKINYRSIKTNVAEVVKKGEILSFSKLIYGFRAYICIKGGFDSVEILGSQSTYEKANLSDHILKKGTILALNPNGSLLANAHSRIKPNDSLFSKKIIPATPGPEYHLINEKFLEEDFEITNDSNRMGYRLTNGNKFTHQTSILTSTVIPGTVQLPPSGHPVVLMRDCQTTGGYPRILQVTELGINILAQKQPGERIKFQITT
ncbi:MAG: biotin-dependent carboxylase-like uncharacterized protein [Cyclobacteriaceae bacterium]|jgi:biotin-dependent carboxylase-like uncharacterized protein